MVQIELNRQSGNLKKFTFTLWKIQEPKGKPGYPFFRLGFFAFSRPVLAIGKTFLRVPVKATVHRKMTQSVKVTNGKRNSNCLTICQSIGRTTWKLCQSAETA